MTHPILTCRLADGSIYIAPLTQEYIGIASDGVQVFIGNVGMEDHIERYLQTHQTPNTW